MKKHHQQFLISTDKSLLQIGKIHNFLSKEAYWCQGVPLSVVKKAIDGSLCFGIYDLSSSEKVQIGYGRVVSDFTTFAWLCDVYVEKEYRDKGLSKWLMDSILDHSDLQGLQRICLATKDVHKLYEKYGFKVTETPANWPEIKNNEIYKRAAL